MILCKNQNYISKLFFFLVLGKSEKNGIFIFKNKVNKKGFLKTGTQTLIIDCGLGTLKNLWRMNFSDSLLLICLS